MRGLGCHDVWQTAGDKKCLSFSMHIALWHRPPSPNKFRFNRSLFVMGSGKKTVLQATSSKAVKAVPPGAPQEKGADTAPPQATSRMICFTCGQAGHTANRCTSKVSPVATRQATESRKRCTTCGAEGHHASRCPRTMRCMNCLETTHYIEDCEVPAEEKFVSINSLPYESHPEVCLGMGDVAGLGQCCGWFACHFPPFYGANASQWMVECTPRNPSVKY